MSHKATKKLIAAAMEAQNTAPKPLLAKAGIVKKIEFDNDVKKFVTLAEQIEEKFRGYKVKQSNPARVADSAPSRMF